jgi:YidC/Oxa1 family membrane protein insertase
MPESNRDSKQRKELSMELRLLIAFILMGVVLFVTPYFFKPAAPPPAPVEKKTEMAPPTAAQTPPAPAAKPAEAPTAPTKAVAAESVQSHIVDTEVFRVTFSNQGAAVRSWKLKKYRDAQGKELELVNTAAEKVDDPFSLLFRSQKPSVDLNQALYAIEPQPDGVSVHFTFSNGQVVARKRFHFDRSSYQFHVSTDVRENNTGIPHHVTWLAGFGDMAVHGAAANQRAVYFDLSTNSLERVDAGEAKDAPYVVNGNYSFLGITDNYFAAVFLPGGTGSVDLVTVSNNVPSPVHQEEQAYAGVAVGGWPYNSFDVFVGPKDLDILERVNPKLTQMVDFGWFAILARPLFLGLHWIYENWVQNWGWAIVVITIIINFLLFPLKLTSLKSMKKMQALQPQIAVINEKYKNVGLRDPRKAQQNQEVMELYRKHGVNPMGGCLPMVLQIPFFIAFYNVLSSAIELRHANWLWVSDLSQPEQLAIKVLPLAMIASQFVMQKMTPSTSMDPAQQRIMMLMPLMLGFMFYWVASGLVLYWLTGNLVGIGQQWLINKTAKVPTPPPLPAPRKGKK